MNNAGAQVTQEKRTEADGSVSVYVIVDRVVAQKLGTPGTQTNNALRQGFDARQQLARR